REVRWTLDAPFNRFSGVVHALFRDNRAMTTSVEYPSGAPAWLDLAVPDVGRAAGFYGELLGWEFDTGPYTTALLDGRRVAGLSSAADPAGPACWTAHLATPDLDGSLETAAGLGGRVLSGPEDVAGLGTRAVVREPAGTEFALWSRGSLGGAEAFGVPGAPIWAEATSADVPATADFLVRMFGYEAERIADAEYVTLYSGGSPVCGVYAGAGERIAAGRGPRGRARRRAAAPARRLRLRPLGPDRRPVRRPLRRDGGPARQLTGASSGERDRTGTERSSAEQSGTEQKGRTEPRRGGRFT